MRGFFPFGMCGEVGVIFGVFWSVGIIEASVTPCSVTAVTWGEVGKDLG